MEIIGNIEQNHVCFCPLTWHSREPCQKYSGKIMIIIILMCDVLGTAGFFVTAKDSE